MQMCNSLSEQTAMLQHAAANGSTCPGRAEASGPTGPGSGGGGVGIADEGCSARRWTMLQRGKADGTGARGGGPLRRLGCGTGPSGPGPHQTRASESR